MGISLSIRHPVDRIIWAHTPSSMFTISNAYKLLVLMNLCLMQAAQIWKFRENSGRAYGSFGFPIKLNILFGELATMLCQLW